MCRITRLATFPNFLFLHVQKFTVGSDWVERKLGIVLLLFSLLIAQFLLLYMTVGLYSALRKIHL